MNQSSLWISSRGRHSPTLAAEDPRRRMNARGFSFVPALPKSPLRTASTRLRSLCARGRRGQLWVNLRRGAFVRASPLLPKCCRYTRVLALQVSAPFMARATMHSMTRPRYTFSITGLLKWVITAASRAGLDCVSASVDQTSEVATKSALWSVGASRVAWS